MKRSVTVRTSPSLALIKYWGKKGGAGNIPATSSLAVTLDVLKTDSTVELAHEDSVTLSGEVQDPRHFQPFFDKARELLQSVDGFRCVSRNNFSTASGLASSSSGFAALAVGIKTLTGASFSKEETSSLARAGSASAARAVFGGFTCLPAGAESARVLHQDSFWPELRVIVVSVSQDRKPVSSRAAMAACRETSPFYESWVEDSEKICTRALSALEKKDLSTLGPLIRMSYLRMFSTMISSDPPIVYWQPGSLGIVHLCARLREEGVPAWETMDAGPQVKILCLEEDAETISRRVAEEYPDCAVLIDRVGPGPEILEVS